MTVSIIESVDAAALTRYRASDAFKAAFFVNADTRIDSGVQHDVEIDEQGQVGSLHYLLIQDKRQEDNSTYRLSPEGKLEYWASGVEV